MPTNSTVSVDFLTGYVRDLLRKNGISLTPEQEVEYVPQVLAQVQIRLGLELVPKLNPKDRAEFVRLSNDGGTDAETWAAFWQDAMPEFKQTVEHILNKFAARTSEILG